MLRRLPAIDASQGRVTRDQSYLVLVMRIYPRYLKRDLIDEYVRRLAPEAELFKDFKDQEKKVKNHNRAFHDVRYEERFWPTKEGILELKHYVEMSKTQDVIFLCQCRDFDLCHTDLLLLFARSKLGGEIKAPMLPYPEFEKRLAN